MLWLSRTERHPICLPFSTSSLSRKLQ
jgi:hypothetical protein